MSTNDNQYEQDMSVAELLAKHPELVPALVAAGMICVGCAMAIFCDLLYVKDIYGLNVGEMIQRKKNKPNNG